MTYNQTWDKTNLICHENLNRVENELNKMLDGDSNSSWTVDNKQDGTGSITRSLGTTYTNNSGRLRFVMVSVDLQPGSLSDEARARALRDPGGSSDTICEASSPSGVDATDTEIMFLVVDPGQDYRVNDVSGTNGSASVRFWHEFDFDAVYSAQTWSLGDVLNPSSGSPDIDTYTNGVSTVLVQQSATHVNDFTPHSDNGSPEGIFFRDDGTQMYVMDTSDSAVYQYNLSTAWATSTASLDTSKTVTVSGNRPIDCYFRSDGKRMYIADLDSNSVKQFSLSTAWDVSTASEDKTFSVGANQRSIFFKNDGTKMYVSNVDSELEEYNLSTAWDIGSASLHQTETFSSDINKLFFVQEGEKAHIMRDNYANQYDVSTAWDISTLSKEGRKAFDDTYQNKVFTRDDGRKIYFTNSGDYLREYDLSVAYTIREGEFGTIPSTFSPPTFVQQGLTYSADTAEVQIADSGGSLTSIAEVGTGRSLSGSRSRCVPSFVNDSGDHGVDTTASTFDPSGSIDNFPQPVAITFSDTDEENVSVDKWDNLDAGAGGGWNTQTSTSFTTGLGSADLPRTASSSSWTFVVVWATIAPGTGDGEVRLDIDNTTRTRMNNSGNTVDAALLGLVPPGDSYDVSLDNNSSINAVSEWVVSG